MEGHDLLFRPLLWGKSSLRSVERAWRVLWWTELRERRQAAGPFAFEVHGTVVPHQHCQQCLGVLLWQMDSRRHCPLAQMPRYFLQVLQGIQQPIRTVHKAIEGWLVGRLATVPRNCAAWAQKPGDHNLDPIPHVLQAKGRLTTRQRSYSLPVSITLFP